MPVDTTRRVLVTAPIEEPLTLAEAKAQLRVDTAADDSYITALIKAARERFEELTSRALVTQTWDLFLDIFPGGGYYTRSGIVPLPLPPLQSVSSVKYTDLDGVLQTLASTEYLVDANGDPARLVPAYQKSWPTTRAQLAAVQIRFVAGYGGSVAVPESAKLAMKLAIGHWYENREQVVDGRIAELPEGFEALIWQHRWTF